MVAASPVQARPGTPEPEAITDYLKLHRGELSAMLGRRAECGTALARRHSRVMDGLVQSLFQAATASGRLADVPVALGAVGGYGRGLLGWKSDLDVRIVTDGNPERAQRLAEALLYPLWDAGVSIGHQVSTVADLVRAARTDLPTATSLLDFRFLAGEERLSRLLLDRAFAGLFSEGELPTFFGRLEEELRARHARFGDSVYLLEPDVKSGAGGLRDLDIALWAARARFRSSSVHDLHTLGVLSAAEATELTAAKDFLWSLRNHLHRRAGRRNDRLTFEEQEALAELVGETPAAPAASEDAVAHAVEVFMSTYYRHARVVLRMREQIIARAMPPVHRSRPRILDLAGGVQLFNDQVTFTRVADLDSDPALALRIFSEAIDRGATLLPFARDVITRATSRPAFGEALRSSKEAAQRFVALVSDPRKAPFRNGSILAELHDTGLLTAMIPEFLPVVGRVHHDVYHVYTVDVHSVAAVDFVRALARGEHAGEHALATTIAEALERPSVLYLATLLHDVGKAIGGRDHAARGAEMARVILGRLGLSEADIESACHLVLHHLAMYQVAARRNLEDPSSVAEFARTLRGRESLRQLFLLTVADLSTTSPTSMTKWKRHMLDDLFRLTDRALSPLDAEPAGRGGPPDAELEAVRAAVRAQWDSPLGRAFLDEYLSSMPPGYLLANGPKEIAWHARVAFGAREKVVVADLAPARRHDVAELCVVTGARPEDPLCIVARDRPGLLAAISAAITANGFDVHAAQIHTRRSADGRVQAMDLFWVTSRTVVDEPERALQKLQRDLECVVTGAIAPGVLAGSRRTRFSERPIPAVPTQITVDNSSSATHTVVEVVTRDRPGLLFMLARTFHELDLTISVAKINTEGTRVLDVFHVAELDGRKVENPDRMSDLRRALTAAIGGAPQQATPVPTRLEVVGG